MELAKPLDHASPLNCNLQARMVIYTYVLCGAPLTMLAPECVHKGAFLLRGRVLAVESLHLGREVWVVCGRSRLVVFVALEVLVDNEGLLPARRSVLCLLHLCVHNKMNIRCKHATYTCTPK